MPLRRDHAQGLTHLIKDGLATDAAALANTALLAALQTEGTPAISRALPDNHDPRHSQSYSPLWQAQLGQRTNKAVKAALNTLQTDENQILNLAAGRPDLLTGLRGTSYGSTGCIISCPVSPSPTKRRSRTSSTSF